MVKAKEALKIPNNIGKRIINIDGKVKVISQNILLFNIEKLDDVSQKTGRFIWHHCYTHTAASNGNYRKKTIQRFISINRPKDGWQVPVIEIGNLRIGINFQIFIALSRAIPRHV